MHANAELNAALRETFGFGKGLCASDAGDVSGVAGYRVASDQTHAGALSMLSGMDQDLEFPCVPCAPSPLTHRATCHAPRYSFLCRPPIDAFHELTGRV
jgi:hypothetical protein